MKKKAQEKKPSKSNDLNNIDLSEEELTKIKTISEYLFMDQYQDTCAYPRFEECFGAFCLEKSIDLPKVFNNKNQVENNKNAKEKEKEKEKKNDKIGFNKKSKWENQSDELRAIIQSKRAEKGNLIFFNFFYLCYNR